MFKQRSWPNTRQPRTQQHHTSWFRNGIGFGTREHDKGHRDRFIRLEMHGSENRSEDDANQDNGLAYQCQKRGTLRNCPHPIDWCGVWRYRGSIDTQSGTLGEIKKNTLNHACDSKPWNPQKIRQAGLQIDPFGFFCEHTTRHTVFELFPVMNPFTFRLWFSLTLVNPSTQFPLSFAVYSPTTYKKRTVLWSISFQ